MQQQITEVTNPAIDAAECVLTLCEANARDEWHFKGNGRDGYAGRSELPLRDSTLLVVYAPSYESAAFRDGDATGYTYYHGSGAGNWPALLRDEALQVISEALEPVTS